MKTKRQKFDFLIVGQGLAGSILANKLLNLSKSVAVIDNAHEGSASKVAAGIINPITGHRLNLSDGFETFFPSAERFYHQLELELGVKLWQPIAQTRLLKNQGQKNHYQLRLEQEEYRPYLDSKNDSCELFRNPCYGSVGINHTVVIDVKQVLNSFQSKLKELGCFFSNKVDYAAIRNNGGVIEVSGINASTIIFCEGHQAIYNPWLADLPFKLSKGEILTLATQPAMTTMLNWGQWLVPSDGYAKLGSSFEWQDLSTKNTIKTEHTLMNSLYQHTRISARIEAREAGVRPTTVRRKPFIGQIAGWSNGYCFNGFGSKGCLLIPHYADLLSDHLLLAKPLPSELTQCL